MTMDHLINVLVTITLIEMMVAIGLDVTFAELLGVAKSWCLVGRAALANYVCAPAVTVDLLLLLGAHPLVAAQRFLAERLDRLQQALEALGFRIREGVAALVGGHFCDAVRDALQAALGHHPEPPRAPYRPDSDDRFEQYDRRLDVDDEPPDNEA